MTDIDWPSLVSSVIGALVGGAISSVAIWLLFRAEERSRLRDERGRETQRHDDRFEDALAEVMKAMGAHASAVREWHDSRPRHYFTRPMNDPTPISVPPSNSQIVTTLSIASMLANEEEFEVLHPVGSVVAFIAGRDHIHEASTLEASVALLMIWKRRIVTSAKARSDFEDMAADAMARVVEQERAKAGSA